MRWAFFSSIYETDSEDEVARLVSALEAIYDEVFVVAENDVFQVFGQLFNEDGDTPVWEPQDLN